MHYFFDDSPSPMKRLLKILAYTLLTVFLVANLLAYKQAYNFTHFDLESEATHRKIPPKGTAFLKILWNGIENPKPTSSNTPTVPYTQVRIPHQQDTLDCWHLRADTTQQPVQGTVLMFHGYGGNKSNHLAGAYILQSMGYHVWMIDFSGSGNSTGHTTTIGYNEANEVKTCFDYVQTHAQPSNIILYGHSMGASAITRAVAQLGVKPSKIILSAPFGSMLQAVKARFRMMNLPTFPMASLLVFWGGVQHGFSGFSYRPTEYARHISCPTLLLRGAHDERVSQAEIDAIYQNLTTPAKTKHIFAQSGHSNFFYESPHEWQSIVQQFFQN